MSVTFSTRCSETVYLDANRLDFWLNARSKKPFQFVAWLTAIYFGLVIGLHIYDGYPVNIVDFAVYLGMAIAGAIACLIYCYGLGYLMLPHRSRKMFEQQKLAHLMTAYEVSDDALLYKNEASNGRLPYSLLHKWAEDSKIFLIYHSDVTFEILPKTDISKEALDIIKKNLMDAGITGRSL